MLISENGQIVLGIAPLDLGTARTGDRVSLKNYAHCTIIFVSAVGTDGDDPTITLQQSTVVAGTDAKALTFTNVWVKQAATDLTATPNATKTAQSASETFTTDDSAQEMTMWVLEIDADTLDVDNGFDVIGLNCSDIGSNAQLGTAIYILTEPRYAAQSSNMPTAISD